MGTMKAADLPWLVFFAALIGIFGFGAFYNFKHAPKKGEEEENSIPEADKTEYLERSEQLSLENPGLDYDVIPTTYDPLDTDSRYCVYCGTKVDENTDVCPKCGEQIWK